MGFYRVAKAAEYLVISGQGIDHVNLARKSLISPGKSQTIFDYSPVKHSVKVEAMTAEKLPFMLDTVFAIGTAGDDPDSLLSNAKLHRLQSEYVKEIVQGVVEEVVTVAASSLSMEDVFRDIKAFKQQMVDGIQSELSQFGLRIYNNDIQLPVIAAADAETERQRKKRKLMWDLVGDFSDEINTMLSAKRCHQSKLVQEVMLKNASTQTQCLVLE